MMFTKRTNGTIGRGSVTALAAALLLCIGASTAPAQNMDVSDSVWSIIMPTAAALDVDMGKVLLGKSRDSVVTAFLTNTGAAPIRIDSLYFTGPDAGAFSVMSGMPPAAIQVGATHPVEFHFVASKLGPMTATIVIHAQADTISATIRGEGVEPRMEVVTTLVDFGQVTVNQLRDTTVTTVLRNVGTAPLNISTTRQLGPDSTQFFILSGGGAFTMAPGEEHPMQLRFAPIRVGRTSGRIGFEHDAAGSPALVDLYGEGLHITGSATLWIDSIRAKIGDTVEVAIRLRDTLRVVEAGAERISTELRFNVSMLAPLPGTPPGVMANGVRTILLDSLPVVADAGGAVKRLRFIATLGTSDTTTLELRNTVAINGMVTIKEVPGFFTITNICREGGPRLFDASGGVRLYANRPNPFNAMTEIEFEVLEAGTTQLYVLDVMGRRIATLVDAAVPRGRHTARYDAGTLPSGTYILVLQTPGVRLSRMMEIIK